MNVLRRLGLGVGCGVVLGIASSAWGGDLNPPPGGISPTDDVVLNAQAITLPYAITAPGAYRLTSNLFPAGAGPNGIEIYVDNVWLDLGGFVVDGGPAGVVPGDGIVAFGPIQNITIVNGTVTNWGDDGIDLSQARNCRVKDVMVSHNTNIGVWGPTMELVDCTAKENGQDGVFVFDASIVVRCTATDNGQNGFGNGITAFDHCKVANCVSRGNTGNGFDATFQCVMVDCIANFNTQTGIVVGEHSKAADCVSGGNQLNGIDAFFGGVIVDCVATENAQIGIFADMGCVVTNCKASRNLDGYNAFVGAKLVECSAAENVQYGFYVSDGVTVRECNASLNALGGGPAPGAGIYVLNECEIENNHVWQTQPVGTAGIEVNGIGNRISNNDCKSNPINYLFNAAATGNTLFGNSSTLPFVAGGDYVIIGFPNDIAPITNAAIGASRLDNIIY